jgi:hypothetical protein
VVPILENYGVDLVLSGHSHNYERSYLLHGHYGYSDTLDPSMILDHGSGRGDDTGEYRKTDSGPSANQGAVYVVAGSAGWATYQLDPNHHPAMFLSELEAGSMVIDVAGHRLDAYFVRDNGAVDDWFAILKGPQDDTLRFVRVGVSNGKVTVRWASKPGVSYLLEWTPQVDPPDWQAVTDPILSTGSQTSWDQAAANGASGFYRVSEIPAQ